MNVPAAPAAQPETPRPKRVLTEVLLVFLAATLVIAVLYRVSAPLIHDNLSVLAAAVFLYLPAGLLWRRDEELADYGLRAQPLRRGLAAFAVAAALIVPLFSLGYALFVRRVCGHLPPWLVLCMPAVPALRLPPQPLTLALSQLLVVALPEEFFFRGYLQGRLAVLLRPMVYLPLQAALFALGHLLVIGEPGTLAVFFPGLLFGYLRLRTGTVLAGTLLHALCNLLIDVLHRSLG